MNESTFWDPLVADLAATRDCYRRGQIPEKPFEPGEEALMRYVAASDADLEWFRQGLLHDERKWLVAFEGIPPDWTLEQAAPGSRERVVALEDIWSRKRALNLRTFVFNTNLDVRRSVVPHLDLDPESYSEEDRPLIERAIRIARESDDDYIRHRVEVQLGNEMRLAPLPHRKKSMVVRRLRLGTDSGLPESKAGMISRRRLCGGGCSRATRS
jgi:hypothetical protein